jgi:peptidoglycan/LPS O-acetylase OafA/YrhL
MLAALRYHRPSVPARITHSYFPGFDVFRAFGILAVLLAHTPSHNPIVEALRPLGALGVHMFFALSGFLITNRLVEEYSQTGHISLSRFYKRRIRRILPPAIIYLSILTLLGPILHLLPSTFKEIAAALLFWRNVYRPPVPASWYTAHFWSLSIEEQFYLFWPTILFILGPLRRRATIAGLAIILATTIWRIHVLHLDPSANPYRPDLLADHLVWGCVIGLNWKTIQRIVNVRTRTWLGYLAIAAATALLYLQPPYWQPFFAMFAGIGFTFAADAMRDWAARQKILGTIGEASYDIYIWQSLFLPLPMMGLALPFAQRIPWGYFFIALTAGASFLLTFPRRMKLVSRN